MPFMKVIKRVKGIKVKKGTILLIEDAEPNATTLTDTEGNVYPKEMLAPLTKEEEERCLKVEELQI